MPIDIPPIYGFPLLQTRWGCALWESAMPHLAQENIDLHTFTGVQ